MTVSTLPQAFIWRRLHSLMGLWLTLFLIEHLFVNSQVALLLGDKGTGFIQAVNSIHNLPYLQAIELFLLGTPILIHMIWGIRYLFTSKPNAHKTDGSTPSLKEYGRNKAYSWQRITSWILLIGLTAHVVKFRFLEYPTHAASSYLVKLQMDSGLYTLADRLGVTLYDQTAIQNETLSWESESSAHTVLTNAARSFASGSQEVPYDHQQAIIAHSAGTFAAKASWIQALTNYKVSGKEVVAASPDFGTATLLSVRDAFKNPLYVALYTLFVLAACFHASNGFWTFLITWGVILKTSAQKRMGKVALILMTLLAALGLTSVWAPYLSSIF